MRISDWSSDVCSSDLDKSDYQTMFAREKGAVAAPTAALHFTSELVERLDAAGIARETLTLHVGAGTFLPVKVEDTAEHRMHAERSEERRVGKGCVVRVDLGGRRLFKKKKKKKK